MIKNKKFSLSLINSISLLIFLIITICAIYTSVYFSTQKVIDYNINEYFKQTNNITDIILEREQESLDNNAVEIIKIIKENKNDNEQIEIEINNLLSIDQIDLLFFKDSSKMHDYSNSLFDTKRIMEEISKLKISFDNTILAVNVDGEEHIIFLTIKKFIDEESGRVNARLFVGKILNDNFSILNNIKGKANLEDLFIFYNNSLIATTSNTELIELSMFQKDYFLQKDKHIYFNRAIELYDNKKIDFIFVTVNSTFELIKNDFIKAGYIILIFVILAFVVLYIFSNKFIINPFFRLLNFAKKAKDNEKEVYEKSHVVEFNSFAVELKDVIDELRDLKEQYSRAINGVEDGLWDINFKDNTFFFSKRFGQMLGYSNSENFTSLEFWRQSVHKDDYKKTLKKIALHLKDKDSVYQDNYRFRCSDGSYKWIRVRGKIFFNENDEPARMTGFHTDIDDFIKLQNDNAKKEQMLYQQSKLASMGEMIGNIAHQWRQPLNVISTIASSQIMQIELGVTKKDETIEDLNKLINTVQYLSTIIDKFRYFFNPNKEIEEFFIDEAINDNLELLETSYKTSEINLIINLHHTKIVGYKFELMQVIINIINNARDALVEKLEKDEDKYIFLETYVENNCAVVRVCDNAGGIKDSIREKIYEPYFTTKHQSQGTGLGLYMSNEIIQKHFKGKLVNETVTFTYKNKEYTGEEFNIKIPVT